MNIDNVLYWLGWICVVLGLVMVTFVGDFVTATFCVVYGLFILLFVTDSLGFRNLNQRGKK